MTLTAGWIGKYIVTNNDILRRIRYTFDFKDSKLVDLLSLADHKVTREQASAWLTAIKGLPEVHERLKRVVILQGESSKGLRN